METSEYITMYANFVLFKIDLIVWKLTYINQLGDGTILV